ncbi:hypothetical protein RDI58_013153 [Solanum bulbocastanum]|uniref:Uncharacterized protein n=1 Tax=Solanum bulbocastanum TaxID=147425 RepID=A0AAN8YDQ9_SOLBU
MVGSCRKCQNCSVDLENYYPHQIPTYNGYSSDGTLKFGGYSDMMVSDEHFVVHRPENLSMDAAPLLYIWLLSSIVIGTSAKKKQEIIEHLGVDSFLISRDPEQMKAAMNTLDRIINTISAVHPILPLLILMKSHGKLVMVDASEKPVELPVFPLLMDNVENRKEASGWKLHRRYERDSSNVGFRGKA